MEFSVVVKASDKPPAGEHWEELERFLRSARISPAVLHRLTPGKVHILKKRLSYEQALRICDRLSDFGLPSAVNPPTKPEAGSKVARLKPAAPALNNKIPAPPAAKTKTGEKPAGLADKQTHPVSRPIQPGNSKQLADEIRKMFALPADKSGADLPRAHRLHSWLLALRGLSFAAVMLAAGTVAILCCAAMIGMVYWLTSIFSPFLAVLLASFLSALSAGILASLALPLWRSAPQPALKMDGKAQPQFVLLSTALCKLIAAPAPASFVLTAEARVVAEYRCKRRSFLRLREPLQGELVLHVGLPLLASLETRELAALIAGECGRYGNSALRRPYWLLSQQRQWSAKHLAFAGLRDKFPTLDERIPQGRLVAIDRLIGAADRLQRSTCRILGRYHDHLDALLMRKDPTAIAYHHFVLGDHSTTLQEKIEKITSDLESAVQDAVKSGDLYLPDSVSQLIRSSEGNEIGEPASTGVVRCRKPARLLVSRFADADQAIARKLYDSKGICLNSVQLVSGAELRQRQSNAALLDKSAREYFGVWFDHRQFWVLPPEHFASQAEQKIILSRLNHCISRIRFLSPDRRELLSSHDKLRHQASELDAARVITASGHRYSFKHCPGVGSRDLDAQSAARHLRLGDVREELAQQNSVMGERLALGLALERRHRTLTGKLHRALLCMAALSEKVIRLEAELEKLELLKAYKPRRREQQYHIHLDELHQSIEGLYRLLHRKLQQCPYDFFDRRFATLDTLFSARLQQRSRRDGELTILQKSRVLLTTIAEAYEYTSKLAAYFAVQMEKAHRVETVRRL